MHSVTSRLPLLVILGCAFSAASAQSDDRDVAYREPFTIRMRIDRTHYFEEKKPRLPYVANGEVALFIGDHFGLKIDVQNNTVRSVKYEPDLSKADVTLQFKQGDPAGDGVAHLRVVR